MIFHVLCSGGFPVSTVEKFHPGGSTVKHMKIFRLTYHSALETTALPPMRKPEMEGWRFIIMAEPRFGVKAVNIRFLKHQKMLISGSSWK